MDWQDEGMLLSARRHGEDAAILEVLTRDHGRHAGVMRGAASRRMAPLLQPGAQLQLAWKARLDEHIGAFAAEPLRSRAARLMADRAALAAFGGMVALLHLLPEREPHPELYARSLGLADRMGPGADWHGDYVRWELGFLAEAGFGLDLTSCAATGAREGLTWVSPKSGRAVSAAAGEPWRDQLLPLPRFLVSDKAPEPGEIADGLRLTGFFLGQRLAPALPLGRLPEARARAAETLSSYGKPRPRP
jgi:DNA repair protein RecO (recombination protein O)